MPRDKFATAITCIDGRVQQPIADWMKLNMNVDYVDLVTEPGPDKALSDGSLHIINEIVRKVSFSILHHSSNVVAVTGHHDCAANDADKEEHIEQILDGIRLLHSYEINVRVLGLYLSEWNSVEVVWDTQERAPTTSFL